MTTPPGDQPHDPYQQPYGQQPYQQPQPYPYQPGYGGPGYPVQQDHPKATTAMVLGILGVVACQIAAPFAWAMGKRTVGEIDASGGRLGGRGQAQAGYILGIVGTVLLGLAIVFIVIYFVIIVALIGGMASTSTSP